MGNLVGKHAPHFNTTAVIDGKIINNVTLTSFAGKYVILFFYPLNFTFVCPTELHAFQERLADFEKRNAQVVGCSVDSCYSHMAWINTPKSRGGIQGVTYPILSDLNRNISQEYGVLIPSEGIAYRGLYLIDRSGVVRHQVINDLPIGRSVDETLRTLDALIYFEKHGEVCPANWQEGKVSMKPTQEGLEKFFAKN